MSDRYQVPPGVEIATQWAWRLLVIAAAGALGIWLLRYFSELTVPLAVALLGTALTISVVDWLNARGLPRLLSTFIVVITMLLAFFGMLALVGQQLSTQAGDLRSNVVEGISQVQEWAKDGPLDLSDTQIEGWVDDVKQSIASSDTTILTRVGEVGDTVTHLVAGFFIALFASFFFLYDGQRIWSWVVALFPRTARARVDSSGHTAWVSLTAFVRATVIVAFTDAVGIALGAWLLGVPLTLAIGVLVFLGAFVPIIGALLSGMVAVLVALVAQGPWTALIMLLVVIAVQQIEAHVLQPFLMGRLVAVHPLAIILAIAAGVTVAGVVGALIAVPLAACLNGVVRHLVAGAREYQDEPEGEVDLGPDPA
ncbi:AI-2E family transporter [Aeromicrobium wangtongii]|uniref:AI-2E family transporter n=1 Tax=Aeromicrobium wangtongii TaxID=2969247 RepID=A0ABY5MBC5_9ACTN|nr:AI-2E family transporter [Aeromicrobium wangtongii]MCD9196925.1 AI-2E family transporter [Aeromicrobium wangtongii]UUP14431.1 AI-2E family transporter [Aeromicrobium wangtongii]